MNDLIKACEDGKFEIVKELVKNGAYINFKNQYGYTAFHYAADNGHLDIVKFLVENGADANIRNNSGFTALHWAASCGYSNIVKFLAENGADVNAQDSDGLTALDCAVKSDYLDIVEYLKDKTITQYSTQPLEEIKIETSRIDLTYSNVTHPKHYNSHPSGIECINITRHMNFNLGNAIKYIWRNGLKESDNNIQDLKKAIWYLEDEIKRLSDE